MPSSLADNLQLQPGMRCFFINAPTPFASALRPLPDDCEIVDTVDAPVDYVHVFATSAGDVEQYLPEALKRVEYDGLLWVSWPKDDAPIDTDLDREVLVGVLSKFNYRPVRSVSVSDVWSALRFRPRDAR